MICTRCGFESPTGFAFCGKCGQSLTAPVAVMPLPALTAEDAAHWRTYLPSALFEALQFDLYAPSTQLLSQCATHLWLLLLTTASHLPDYVVQTVLADPQPGRAGGQFVEGTLLFADISGFTAMSERLNQKGREGAEEITTIVNRYFRIMLAIMRDHGGQLIKFGGDALLGLFPERPLTLLPSTVYAPPYARNSATRATQAATQMQAAMSQFAETTTSQGTFPLRMKVGLHRGRFFAAQLGTAQNMEYALFGRHVNLTAAAESAAMAGQVLLDQETYAAIDLPCTAVPLPHNPTYLAVQHISTATQTIDPITSLLPKRPEPTVNGLRRVVRLLDALTPYLPPGLLSRLSSDPNAPSLAGEHRLVAILFANVHGLGDIADHLGPGRETDIVAALNHYFVQMARAVERYGGVINKIDLYDHGDKLLILFGAPITHEDDAERAARAALDIQAALTNIQNAIYTQTGLPGSIAPQPQIGISYGYVFAGYVGAEWRHEYTVMGDQVNLAARLMSTAVSGHTLISRNVRHKIQALFDLESQGEVFLKGKSDPVSIFAIRGLRAVPASVRGLAGMHSPLVGREAEWRQLQGVMSSFLAHRGQIVSLIGEAGLGKSRLLAELQETLEEPYPGATTTPVQWVDCRCLSYTESVSYWAFQELLRRLLHLGQHEDTAVTSHALRYALEERLSPEEAANHFPYIANFLNLPLGDAGQDRIRYLDAEALQRRTFLAVRVLLESQAQVAPLILVLDDIHWLDHASCQLLLYLFPLVNQRPIMWLLLYRPERDHSSWSIRETAVRSYRYCYTEITLHPLDRRSTQTLLSNLVAGLDWPPETRDLLLDRTEGNPLYLEEVLRSLINDKSLTHEGNSWQVKRDLTALNVPDTLQGVMMARLDRLAEHSRWTAQIAATVGRVFPYDVILHMVNHDASDTLGLRLVHLQQYEIITETQRAPEVIYSFLHSLMQEVCYNSLAVRAQREYHRRIAAYLATNRSAAWGDTRSLLPVIAHHAYLGQDWSRALPYQMQAGERAKQLFATHEAIDHFHKALECTRYLPQLTQFSTHSPLRQIHAALGELLVNTSRYEEAQTHLQQAFALAVAEADGEAQAGVCRWMARSFELRGEYPAAFEWIERGLAALHGRAVSAPPSAVSAPPSAVSAPPSAEAAQILLIAGLIHIRQGDYDQAITRCRQALEMAETLGEVTARARAYNLLGITYLRGDSQAAIAHFQQAFALYQAAGDLYGQATSHNLIANAGFNLGHWRQADEHYRQARQLFEQIGDIYNLAMADNNLGGVTLNRGQLDEALAFYAEAQQALQKIAASPYVRGLVAMNLGATYSRRQEPEAAFTYLQAAQRLFEEAQSRDFLPELYRHMGQAQLGRGRLAEAAALAQTARQLAQELHMPGEAGAALTLTGQVSLARASTDPQAFAQARIELEQSIVLLAETGEEYQLARSRYWLAQAQIGLGERVAALATLAQAQQVFQRLEALLDVTAVADLQTQLQ